LLNRYIPSVTIIGGIIIGLLAGVSNVFSVFGTGIGLLLMVDILVNYYNLLVREQVDVHMPKLASLIGRD
jgi:preprotein translocase subunit SecY